ncbi:MAG: enoyl-CoA hydratase/isomerase family protein [Rhodobacteraceae bacterium]|nr:enoyl-CoA hydratase/isomerase family protein [Paracoccaceae bacterium]
MGDIDIRVVGQAGRITFTRAHALNAMTYEMCMAIDAAMRSWADDPDVALVVIDAEGDKAFCAGGDIAKLYATGRAGNFAYGRTFWRDEYRLNAFIAEYPKPVVSFMQGFVMGGGVGIGCHAGIRVVDDTTRIAMPECGIGLVPDVGGSYLLARAPGRLGEYLGLTGMRMTPDDAIFSGFADVYLARAQWRNVIEGLESGDDAAGVVGLGGVPPGGALRRHFGEIEAAFTTDSVDGILDALQAGASDFALETIKVLKRNSPLSMACTIKIIQKLRSDGPDIRQALGLEYRFTYRSMQAGDFLEGIRAQIIDKDRCPVWKHGFGDVPEQAVKDMLSPLEEAALTF